MKKRNALYATLEPFKKKVVKYLTPYYYQNGVWDKVENLAKNQDENRAIELIQELNEIGERLDCQFQVKVK